jgi:hypothetical protein
MASQAGSPAHRDASAGKEGVMPGHAGEGKGIGTLATVRDDGKPPPFKELRKSQIKTWSYFQIFFACIETRCELNSLHNPAAWGGPRGSA